MPLLGKGMLITFTEVPADIEEDYNEWYNREHIDERVFMPGFTRARRYVDADGTARIKYFATYETEKVGDLCAPEYMKRLGDQSDWSKRIMAQFSKFDRLTVAVTVDQTHGVSGAAGVLRFFPAPDKMNGLRSWLEAELLPELSALPGMTGACLVENDLETVNIGLQAQGKTVPDDQQVEWILILDGATVEATAVALDKALNNASWASSFDLQPSKLERANYRFLFGNAR